MSNWQILSDNFRLTPWSLEEHAGYVLQEYGKLLSTPEKAQAYVDGYKAAEAQFDQAYANQQEFLNRTTTAVGAQPQVLPPIQKIDWDPVKRMAAVIDASKVTVTVVPVPAPELPPVEVIPPAPEPVVPETVAPPEVAVPSVEVLADAVVS